MITAYYLASAAWQVGDRVAMLRKHIADVRIAYEHVGWDTAPLHATDQALCTAEEIMAAEEESLRVALEEADSERVLEQTKKELPE